MVLGSPVRKHRKRFRPGGRMSARVGVRVWIFWLKAALRRLIFKKLRHKTMRNNILRDEMKNFLKVCVFCITKKIYLC